MKRVYLQVSTHWDREWYNSFQAFRYELINTTKKIISELALKKNINYFVFDGQTIVVEDYLEIMPRDYDNLADVVKDGSMKLGPWYVMPDEWLVSGESLIRNFLQGKQICDSFGVMPYSYGYINDIFGHIAQFPQILNQVGIRMAYLGRGLSAPGYDFKHFVWQSPDGSKCFGYKDNYSMAYRSYQQFLASGEKTEAEKDEYVRQYVSEELSKCKNGVLLLNITDDHAYLNETMLDLVQRVRKLEQIEVIESGFDGAYDAIAISEDSLPVVCGELIMPAHAMDMRVVTDAISSYYPLKEENDRCQSVLENETAPMIAYSHMAGKPVRKEFLQAAYKELLKNHPHDDICGCSTDQVHKDMYYRYEQVKEVAKAVERDFICKIGRAKAGTDENYLLEIFNPAPYEREQIITVDLEFEQDFFPRYAGNAPYQPRNMFRLFDSQNRELKYQIMNIERNLLSDRYNISQEKPVIDRYTISFPAKLTAFGMTEYLVTPTKAIIRNKNTMKSGDSWAENAYVRIEIRQDGTFDLHDKVTGKAYEKLHYFLDDAEAGNGWFHEDAANQNAIVSSRFSACTVEKIRSGSMEISFCITKIMLVPEKMDYDTYSRSEEKVELKIISEITLKQDSGKVYIRTKVVNNAKDHRLKMMLPTQIAGDTYWVSQAFYFGERVSGVYQDTHDWFEPMPQEGHFDGIIYKTDANGNGLAFVGQAGFHQAGVLDDEESTISIVMFRSFGRAYMINDPQKSQIPGELTFCYTIVPMNENVKKNTLLAYRKYDFRKETAVFSRCAGRVEAKNTEGMLKMEGDGIALSIIKVAEKEDDSIIFRVFNTENRETFMQVTFGREVKQVSAADLYENATEIFGENVSQIKIKIKPFEIRTLVIKFTGRDSYAL